MYGSPLPAQNTHKGRHYEFIKNATHENFKTATVSRAKALTATRLKIEPWYTTVPALHHEKLKAANLMAWGSQNQVDKLFEKLQDIHSFAAPLLQAKLKERYGIDHDVKTTYLYLYLPKDKPWYVMNLSGGVTSHTVSLLEAALHNFARTETVHADSQFITRPDSRGHFDVLPIKKKMTIGQFQALCRELDIGARYKEHIERFLLPGEPVAEAVMKLKVIDSQKDALRVAAQLALTTGDIQYDAYKLVLDLTNDAPQLLLNGREMVCCDLSMMETRLTGIALLIPAVKDSRGIRRLIAYVPHDPDHPLKEYDSPNAFMTELTRQLRENKTAASSQLSYRQFFSQFVDQQQRGHFFADLDQRITAVKWHEKEDPTDQRPTWREEPIPRPHLQFRPLPLPRDFWRHSYQQKLNKVLNDAREIAVSTADTDSKARWAWWDNFKKIVSDIFNVALLVATPLVPGVGELMMAYTAYQLTSDVIEGIVDLAEGLGVEAAEHVISVVTDVIQLAAFAAAIEIGSAFRLKLSPLIEGMKPVKLPDGKLTLWHPDLAPYEQQNLSLSAGSKPDQYGLHQAASKQILPLEGKLYYVEKASTEPTSITHLIKHPTRPNAYSPRLEHNGHGAWAHEGEVPGHWQGEILMRRLGHSVDRFSPTELEQIRISSGTDDNVLRRMHVENAAPPAVLADTIKRFSAYDEAKGQKGEIARDLYLAGERSSNAQVALLRQTFPDMPLTLTEKLLTRASPAELQRMTDEHRLPLRIKSLAREMNFEAAAARAYEGFYRDEMSGPDTERLALSTLKFSTDSFGDLRIEVLDGTGNGTLRCSVGPDDASTVRRLVRDEHGRYEVLDADNNTLHEAGDFYESILCALPDDKRSALGYQPGQGRRLKQWIMEKSAPPAERRTVLAEPPIRPVARLETEHLVRGWFWFLSPKTPEEKLKNLYPKLNEHEVKAFIEALRAKGDPDQAIDLLKDEIDELRNTLAVWENNVLGYVPPDGDPGADYLAFRSNGGRHIRERLLECFERKGQAFGERSTHPESGYTLDLSSDLAGPNLERWWKNLREQPEIKKYLDQVTVLNLDNARFSSDAEGLLNDFPHIRHLTARYSDLTELPSSVGKMRLLETLRLSNNRIRLTPESAKQLAALTRLETLRLDGNPLMQPVDVGRMPGLKVLSLNTTGLNVWPERLFKDGIMAKHRPRSFYLDLRNSPINTVPDIAPGSNHALIVARTRLDTRKLSDADRVRLENYRQSVGFAPQQTYDAAATEEISHWRSLPDDSALYNNVTGVGAYREESWHDVASEPYSDDFFKVIRTLRESSDYRASDSRKLLTKRVWEVIDAVALDTNLRERLFSLATEFDSCEDGGAQLFNSMGIEVLKSKAYAESTSAQELENNLVKLTKSNARLKRVAGIARKEIESQQAKSDIDPDYHAPDHVEVHLAYQTGLAKRLGLPWQSENMLYWKTSRVKENMIDDAYSRILELEKDDGLVNSMIELEFWEKYLQKNNPAQFEANTRLFEDRPNVFDELRTVQNEWVETAQGQEKDSLRIKLKQLAKQLNMPDSQVLTGEKMTQQFYDDSLSRMGYERNELARKLTREAMAKAGI